MSLGNAAVQNKSFCCLCWIFLCGWINKLWFRSCCSCCLLVFWLNPDFQLESVVSLSEYYLVSSSCWVTITLRLILNWKTAQVSNFKYIFVYNQIIIGEFLGNSDFFFSLRNFSFREFCVFSLKILPFVRFLTFWGNSDFFSILNFWGISDLFENEDFDSKFCSLLKSRLFFSTLTFSWNSDFFGGEMTYLGILTLLELLFFQLKFFFS